jgi:hypothetical protein
MDDLQVTVDDPYPDLKMLCIVEYILLILLWYFYVADSCCVHSLGKETFVVFPFVSSNMHEIMLFELLDFPVPA